MRSWLVRRLPGWALLLGVALAVWAWCLTTASATALAAVDAVVDVRFERAPVHDVLRVLAEAQGINLIIDQGVACEVSMNAQGLTASEALELVTGVCGLYLERIGSTLVVSSAPKGLTVRVGETMPPRLKFTEHPVREVLEALAERAGWNLISAVPLNREVTAWLDGMEDIEALRLVAAAAGLSYQLVDRVLYIKGSTADAQADRVVIHRLDYVEPAKAKELVEVFVPGARVEVDQATRSLVVSGSNDRLKDVAKFLQQFDTARPQVLVEARILEVAVDALETLGVDWPTAVPFAGAGTPTAFELLWNPAQLQATLRSLSDRGRSKVLASPKISAVDGEQARMLIGDRVPIVTENVDSEGRVSQSVEYLDVGIMLQIEPSIAADGLVTLDIRTEVSSVVDPESRFPTVRTREATSRVRVQDGHPLIIGGLIEEEERERMTGIPLLSELPILGALFGKRVLENVQTETIIVLIPYIVNDGAASTANAQSGAVQPTSGATQLTPQAAAADKPSSTLASLEAPALARWARNDNPFAVSIDLIALGERATEIQFEKDRGRSSLISRFYVATDTTGAAAWSIGAGFRVYADDGQAAVYVRPWIDAGAEYAKPLYADPLVVYTAGAGVRLSVGEQGLLELYTRHQEPSKPGALLGLPGRTRPNLLGVKLGWRY